MRPRNVLLKFLVLFIGFNVLWYAVQPLNALNRLTIYNTLVPGRVRLPFSEAPDESYSLQIASIEQMLASHVVARPKAADEFRVLMLGDSSVWGYLLGPEETQAACINRLDRRTPDGRRVVVYNLGYPKLSVIKDWLILDYALDRGLQPDLILWPITLASLYPKDQWDFPIITGNADQVERLRAAFFGAEALPFAELSTWDKTFFGQRRQIADWLRHQLYGPAWAATRIDHVVPKFVPPHATNLLDDENLLSVEVVELRTQGRFTAEDMRLDVLANGRDLAASRHGIETLVVNQPIYRNEGHPTRYNTYYPRWAYDSYREATAAYFAERGIPYVDLWDAAPPDAFTDTDFHLNAAANCAYAERLADVILTQIGASQ